MSTLLPQERTFTRKLILIAGAIGLGLIGVHVVMTLF